jgi:peptide subunit release factor 1 (eRF1)
MEQRGTTVTPLADLDDLRALVSRPGPFLTDYAAFEPATEALADEVRLRWESRRRSVSAAGAPEPLLDRVSSALEGEHRDSAGLAVVAPSEGEALVERLASVPEEAAAWQPVPVLRPLIALRQHHVPHVVALVDRTGADLGAWTSSPSGDRELHRTVIGDDDVVRKVAPGGWSQRRFQQRAEDSWQRNMAQVADELTDQADRVHAALVAVGGDERAVGYLIDALPARLRDRAERIGVTRAADGSADRLGPEVDAELAGWSSARVEAALALHAEELGQDDRATAGAGRTLEALRAARVAVLLVAERATGEAEERRAWVGPTRDQVATTPADIADADGAEEVPLLDGAVAAALATGAGVLVVPGSDDGTPPAQLRDGLGALLRW